MDMRVILLSPIGEIREAYCEELSKIGIQPDVVATFKELYDSMAQNSYNGVILDIKTKLQTHEEENTAIMNILERFPVAELRWNSATKETGIYYQGQKKEGGSMDDFVNRVCCIDDAKKISEEERFDIYFSVMLARSNDFSEENIEKTISLDISKKGCCFFSKDKWGIGDSVWFIVKDLTDQSPIIGKVRWSVEWGTGIQHPGFGITFDQVKQAQINEMFSLLQTKWQRR